MSRKKKIKQRDKRRINNLLTLAEHDIKSNNHEAIQAWSDWFTRQGFYDFQQSYSTAIQTFPGGNALPLTGEQTHAFQKTDGDTNSAKQDE